MIFYEYYEYCYEYYKLIVPQEIRIDEASRQKTNKYSHFLTNIQNRNVSLHLFEIGSVTGHISERNKNTLTSLHNFVKNRRKFL